MKVDRPRGPAAPDPQTSVGEAGVAKEKPAVSFSEALQGAAEAAGAAATTGPASVEGLLARLRAGEIGIETVVDTLVEQAVQASPLGPKGAEQVREMLRSLLESDPTLRALVREIEQG